MKIKNRIMSFVLMLSVCVPLFYQPLVVNASALEAMSEAELLRQSFQVLEGGAVDSSFTGFEVIEGGLSVAEKEAMVSSFGSQILAGAKALGYGVAIGGVTAVTEYTALEVGYRALESVMDSSAGDEITKLWLKTFASCAYDGTTSLATEKAVLTANTLSGLENLLNKKYKGDFELNAGLCGYGTALGSDYFQHSSKSGVEAYKALYGEYGCNLVFMSDTSTKWTTHYFINNASYAILSGGILDIYDVNGSKVKLRGKCTTSFVIGTDFYGLDTYAVMTDFSISGVGNKMNALAGSGIKIYNGAKDVPITTTVKTPITIPEKPIAIPKSITIPLDVDSALDIANGISEPDIVPADEPIENPTDEPIKNPDNDSDSDTNTEPSGLWGTLFSWLSKILNAIKGIPNEFKRWFEDILNAIKGIPSAFKQWFENIIQKLEQLPQNIVEALKNGWEWLFVPDSALTEAWVQAQLDYIDSQTGVLTYPLAVLLKFFDRVLNIRAGDMILTIPSLSWQDVEIMKETSFNMTKFLNDNESLKSFYGYYLIIIKAVLIFSVINLARKKFYEMEMN